MVAELNHPVSLVGGVAAPALDVSLVTQVDRGDVFGAHAPSVRAPGIPVKYSLRLDAAVVRRLNEGVRTPEDGVQRSVRAAGVLISSRSIQLWDERAGPSR
jgi:hypothetical protein